MKINRRAIRKFLGTRNHLRQGKNWGSRTTSVTSPRGMVGKIVNDIRQGIRSPKDFHLYDRNKVI